MSDPMNGRWAHPRYREYTCRVLEMMDEGLLDPKGVAESLLSWLSEADVKEFYETYELVTKFHGDGED